MAKLLYTPKSENPGGGGRGAIRRGLKGIKVSGVSLKDGKVVKKDSAPPHIRAGRRRKANKVTGVRAAK